MYNSELIDDYQSNKMASEMFMLGFICTFSNAFDEAFNTQCVEFTVAYSVVNNIILHQCVLVSSLLKSYARTVLLWEITNF